jgi:hypothetical protein
MMKRLADLEPGDRVGNATKTAFVVAAPPEVVPNPGSPCGASVLADIALPDSTVVRRMWLNAAAEIHVADGAAA